MDKNEMIDDLIKWLDNLIDPTAFNKWQIRKTTMAKKLLEYKDRSSR